MSDRIFELSLAGVTFLVLVGVVLGIILGLSIFLAVIAGILAEILIGGALLYYWGRSYLAK